MEYRDNADMFFGITQPLSSFVKTISTIALNPFYKETSILHL